MLNVIGIVRLANVWLSSNYKYVRPLCTNIFLGTNSFDLCQNSLEWFANRFKTGFDFDANKVLNLKATKIEASINA